MKQRPVLQEVWPWINRLAKKYAGSCFKVKWNIYGMSILLWVIFYFNCPICQFCSCWIKSCHSAWHSLNVSFLPPTPPPWKFDLVSHQNAILSFNISTAKCFLVTPSGCHLQRTFRESQSARTLIFPQGTSQRQPRSLSAESPLERWQCRHITSSNPASNKITTSNLDSSNDDEPWEDVG